MRKLPDGRLCIILSRPSQLLYYEGQNNFKRVDLDPSIKGILKISKIDTSGKIWITALDQGKLYPCNSQGDILSQYDIPVRSNIKFGPEVDGRLHLYAAYLNKADAKGRNNQIYQLKGNHIETLGDIPASYKTIMPTSKGFLIQIEDKIHWSNTLVDHSEPILDVAEYGNVLFRDHVVGMQDNRGRFWKPLFGVLIVSQLRLSDSKTISTLHSTLSTMLSAVSLLMLKVSLLVKLVLIFYFRNTTIQIISRS